MEWSIRPVKLTDVEGIREVAKITWYSTYGTIYEKEFIARFLEQAYSESSLGSVIQRDESIMIRRFVVAELVGKIVGYAQITQPSDGIVELLRIYVSPDFQGKGIGKALLQSLIDYDKTIEKVFAWVEKENRFGIQYYKSNDFSFEEEKEEIIERQKVRLCKYIKQVDKFGTL